MTTKPQDPGAGQVQLRTERLLLRGLTMNGVDALVEICADIEIARGTASIPHPIRASAASSSYGNKPTVSRRATAMCGAWN
jgi:hypothetical protein